tara:strand:+ start:3268 stop:5724 length:2457 start_codon:yes stop_codon:yes gene_type:complete
MVNSGPDFDDFLTPDDGLHMLCTCVDYNSDPPSCQDNVPSTTCFGTGRSCLDTYDQGEETSCAWWNANTGACTRDGIDYCSCERMTEAECKAFCDMWPQYYSSCGYWGNGINCQDLKYSDCIGPDTEPCDSGYPDPNVPIDQQLETINLWCYNDCVSAMDVLIVGPLKAECAEERENNLKKQNYNLEQINEQYCECMKNAETIHCAMVLKCATIFDQKHGTSGAGELFEVCMEHFVRDCGVGGTSPVDEEIESPYGEEKAMSGSLSSGGVNTCCDGEHYQCLMECIGEHECYPPSDCTWLEGGNKDDGHCNPNNTGCGYGSGCDCGPYQIDFEDYCIDICTSCNPPSGQAKSYMSPECNEICQGLGWGQFLCSHPDPDHNPPHYPGNDCSTLATPELRSACCAEKERRSQLLIKCWEERWTNNPDRTCPDGEWGGKGPDGCYTCKDLAQIHNGGPCGNHKTGKALRNVENYWRSIKTCMQNKCGYNEGDELDTTPTLGACCNGEDCIETTREDCANYQPPSPIGGTKKPIWQGYGSSCVGGRCPHIVIPGDILCDCATGERCYQCTNNPLAWAEGWHCCNGLYCVECSHTSEDDDDGIYEERAMGGPPPPGWSHDDAYCSECKAAVDACLCAIDQSYCQSNNLKSCGGLSKAFKNLMNFTRWWNEAMNRCITRGLCPQQPILQPEEWENLPDLKPPFFDPYKPQECPTCGPRGCKECMIQELGLQGHLPWTPEEIIRQLVALRKCQSDHSDCFGFMLDPENRCCPCYTAPCEFGYYRPNPMDCDCVKIVQNERKNRNKPLKKSNIERQKFWEEYTNDT